MTQAHALFTAVPRKHNCAQAVMAGAGGIFTAMLAEIYEDKIKIDDNLSVPLCVGFALSAML